MPTSHERLLQALESSSEIPENIIFNNAYLDPSEIGKYVSAIANTTAKTGSEFGLLVWGIDPETGSIEGTPFDPNGILEDGSSLIQWLTESLDNDASFEFTSLDLYEKQLVVLEVLQSDDSPCTFQGVEYELVDGLPKPIDIDMNKFIASNNSGSSYAIQERFDNSSPTLERNAPKGQNRRLEELLDSIDIETFFDLIDEDIPAENTAIAASLVDAGILYLDPTEGFKISDFGALALARNLTDFPGMRRKRIVLVRYSGINKGVNSERTVFDSGYLGVLEPLTEAILEATRMPNPITNEPNDSPSPYPSGALSELLVNCLVHQDLDPIAGKYTSPLIEIYDDRIELSNCGNPLANVATIANSNPMVSNEELFGLFARVGICDNREHGWEVIIDGTEQSQMASPAIAGINILSLRECIEAACSAAVQEQDELDYALEEAEQTANAPAVAALSLVGGLGDDAQIDMVDAESTHPSSIGNPDMSDDIHAAEMAGAILPGTSLNAVAPSAQTIALQSADEGRFCVVMKHPVLFRNMSDEDKMLSVYWHACTLFAKGKVLTNRSLRERFSLGKSQIAQISRLLRACVEAGLIKPIDESAPLKLMRYVPAWA